MGYIFNFLPLKISDSVVAFPYAKDALGEKKERLAACYQEYRKLKKEYIGFPAKTPFFHKQMFAKSFILCYNRENHSRKAGRGYGTSHEKPAEGL